MYRPSFWLICSGERLVRRPHGVRLSLSRERARQLEREALRKLRVASEKRRLRAHLGG